MDNILGFGVVVVVSFDFSLFRGHWFYRFFPPHVQQPLVDVLLLPILISLKIESFFILYWTLTFFWLLRLSKTSSSNKFTSSYCSIIWYYMSFNCFWIDMILSRIWKSFTSSSLWDVSSFIPSSWPFLLNLSIDSSVTT